MRRNFPVIGHGRYLLEQIRPEINQYFVESNSDGKPFSRNDRSVVYQRAKGELDTLPFGTQRDVYAAGYEWINHSLAPVHPRQDCARVVVGGPACRQPYSASLLNVSAMSYGSLSKNAVLALNAGAKIGGFAHNTGEGGLSPYHLEPGGDLVWQIGTGYFSCRTPDGRFSADEFATRAVLPNVKMIEVKLSQGAKPGHGGILPAAKLTAEIVAIRGVVAGQDVISPPAHTAFSTPLGLLQFLQVLRDASGGKPVGFKLCVGKRHEFLGIVKAMLRVGHRARLHHHRRRRGRYRRGAARVLGFGRHAAERRAVVRAQRAGRRRVARPGAAHRLGQGEHRLPAGHQGGTRRRHVQRGAGDDVRARLHPGAAVQHQQVPDRRRHAGPRAGARPARRRQVRSASPAITARR